jgi:serine/threonine protein kinase
MESRTKVTKDILAEEGRFILANVLAEGRFSRQNRFDDIRRICESAVTLPFGEYVSFLESASYLRRNRETEALEVTPEGARVANGDNLTEFAEHAVNYFKNRRKGRQVRDEAADEAARFAVSSGGRPSATAGGEIQAIAQAASARYDKLVAIGSGGIGTVYRARQAALGREVALKEVRELFGFFSDQQRDEIVRRFVDVVQAASGLAHPNIVPIHDASFDAEHPYVVSELAPHGSARRLIRDAEELPVGLVMRYLFQTLHALRAAHAAQVFHRGLKPENLLIDAHGNVKVSDFGFQRIVERDQAVIRQVYVGIGSVAYMAPELFTDPTGAGAQADIYALGIIFYELLTRKLPGRRSPLPSSINSALPREVDDVFDKMTRDAPGERYAAVDDILADLAAVDGISQLVGQQSLTGRLENPIESLRFRDPPEPAEPHTSVELLGPDAVAEMDADSKTGVPRPYSYQQRNKRK